MTYPQVCSDSLKLGIFMAVRFLRVHISLIATPVTLGNFCLIFRLPGIQVIWLFEILIVCFYVFYCLQ